MVNLILPSELGMGDLCQNSQLTPNLVWHKHDFTYGGNMVGCDGGVGVDYPWLILGFDSHIFQRRTDFLFGVIFFLVCANFEKINKYGKFLS